MPAPAASFPDPAIRRALRSLLGEMHRDDPTTVVHEELPLRSGRQRADVVVVNGLLAGFEIKSDRDGVGRLAGQVAAYSAVMDRATAVLGPSQVDRMSTALPSWWGIVVVEGDSQPHLREIRSAEPNPGPDACALAELLWRADLLDVLHRRGLSRGYRGAGCRELWERVAAVCSVDELRDEVRSALKRRARAGVAPLLP